jgi:hypothetical protein
MPTELRRRRLRGSQSEQTANTPMTPFWLLLAGELLLIAGMIVAMATAGTIANAPDATSFVQDQPEYDSFFNGLMP